MKINTNTWNRIRYTLYAPGYDLAGKIFDSSRKKAISKLGIKEGDKVLIVGAGTGLDLEFMPSGCHITATDITPSMVEYTRKRNEKLNLNLTAMVMDGQKLQFPDNTFDKVILHLILAVIPEPHACIREAERVLKAGGNISVFDKFVPQGKQVSWVRKLLNPVATFFFTDVTRSFETIVSHTGLTIKTDTTEFKGLFRSIILEKPVK